MTKPFTLQLDHISALCEAAVNQMDCEPQVIQNLENTEQPPAQKITSFSSVPTVQRKGNTELIDLGLMIAG